MKIPKSSIIFHRLPSQTYFVAQRLNRCRSANFSTEVGCDESSTEVASKGNHLDVWLVLSWNVNQAWSRKNNLEKKVQVILQLELDNQSVDGKFPEQRVFSTLCLWQGPIKESRAWLNLREVGFPTNTYVSTAQVGGNLPLWRAETREAQQLSTRLPFSVSK